MSAYWIEIVVALVVTAFGFWGKRELNRVDRALEQMAHKVDRTDLEAALRRLDEHIADDKAMRVELSESLATMNKTLTETQVAVARIAGRFDAQ